MRALEAHELEQVAGGGTLSKTLARLVREAAGKLKGRRRSGGSLQRRLAQIARRFTGKLRR